ncbi:MAG: hypothetical protein QM607_01195, partial [Microbacterium sp.]
MRVEPVLTRADYRDFLRAADGQPRDLAVPLLESTIRSWWTGRTPHPTPVELLVARDDRGAVRGRAVAHTDARFDAKLGTRAQLFGAVELGVSAEGGREVLAALVSHLAGRARETGAVELIGPVSLLPNQAGGVITSGFDERGFVDSAWNPAWVPGVYEDAGFTRWNESDTWIVTSPGAQGPSDAEIADAGITIQHARRRDIPALLPVMRDLVNASFAQLPYYTEISPGEFAAATDGLAWLLDAKLLLIARDGAGQAVAFVLVIPDITPFVQRVQGRLGPLEQVRLLLTQGRLPREAILIIQGTRPDLQGHGILTLLSRQLQANLATGGYTALRSTYVGRD